MKTKDHAAGRSWFSAKAPAEGEEAAEVIIYDEIGFWGIRADAFVNAVTSLGDVKTINLRINSPGGEVFDGLSIYNFLRRSKARVNVTVDGIAASIASVIAMAGDSIVMPANAMMMIHDPAGVVVGTADDMREIADALDKMKTGIASAYTTKTGMTRAKVEKLMADTTWMSAEEAVEMGFADKVEEPVKVTNRFDLSRYKNAPAPAGDEPSGKENTMTTPKDPAGKTAKTEAEIAAEAAAAAAAAKNTNDGNTVETTEQIEARVRDQMTKHTADVMAACELAGFANKASEFIAAKKSLPEVIAELSTLRADRKPAKDKEGQDEVVTTRSNPDGTVVATWDKHIAKINARVKKQA